MARKKLQFLNPQTNIVPVIANKCYITVGQKCAITKIKFINRQYLIHTHTHVHTVNTCTVYENVTNHQTCRYQHPDTTNTISLPTTYMRTISMYSSYHIQSNS